MTVAHEAPPPYEILLHQRSPSTPSRRAIETSWVASISSMHMPSTSSAWRPASSSASWIASTAVSEMGRPMSLANGRWPMPTIATRSWMRRKRSRSRESVMRDSGGDGVETWDRHNPIHTISEAPSRGLALEERADDRYRQLRGAREFVRFSRDPGLLVEEIEASEDRTGCFTS